MWLHLLLGSPHYDRLLYKKWMLGLLFLKLNHRRIGGEGVRGILQLLLFILQPFLLETFNTTAYILKINKLINLN
jgi:hypothetical protein